MGPGGPSDELLRALAAARRRWLGRAGVVGVAAGLKLVGGRPTETIAVQFLVERKLRRPRRPVPRFLRGRDPGGRPVPGARIPTDVIGVGRPALACRAGGSVRAAGERGSIALAFRDKAGGGASWILTCAHVAGDLERSPPIEPELLDREGRRLATVVKNTVAEGDAVEFDLALARVDRAALPIDDLAVEGGGRLAGWLEAEDIEPGAALEAAVASGRRRGPVVSLAAEILAVLDGRRYLVRNLFGLLAEVRPGDSGGLVHDGRGRAAGIVVARSEGGLAWWQPLRPALESLNRSSPRTGVRPFKKGI